MTNRDVAVLACHRERLNFFDRIFAGRGISSVADRARAHELAQHIYVQNIGDQTLRSELMKIRSITRHDAAGFLTSMLKREETELSKSRRLGMAEDAEYPTFFFEFIEREIHLVKLRRRSFQTAEILF
jgi:hypothetical protein